MTFVAVNAACSDMFLLDTFLSPDADRDAGDISVTVCFSFIHFVRRIFGKGYLGRGLT